MNGSLGDSTVEYFKGLFCSFNPVPTAMSKGAFVDFKKLKEQVGIRRILERYELLPSFKEQGERLSGRCPLCEGESDSLRVSQEKNCFKCFRCDAGGNVLDFVAAMENCSIREAALKIAEWFEVQTGKPSNRQTKKAKPAEKKDAVPAAESAIPVVESVVVHELPTPVKEMPPKPVSNAPLTFALRLDPDHPWFAEVGILPETIAEFGLGFCSKGVMGDRIAFPIHDPSGQLLGYAGRWPGESPPEGQSLWRYPPNLDLRLIVFPAHKLASTALKVRWAKDPLEVVLGWQSGQRNLVSVFTREVSLAGLRMLIEATE